MCYSLVDINWKYSPRQISVYKFFMKPGTFKCSWNLNLFSQFSWMTNVGRESWPLELTQKKCCLLLNTLQNFDINIEHMKVNL